FGSRGFGHRTTTGFMSLAQGRKFNDKPKQSPMNGKPLLFDVNTEMGQDYIHALDLAGKYAYAGRDIVVDKVLEIVGGKAVEEVHNHHNYAWKEEHFGEEYGVVRKGCTTACHGQRGFIDRNI